MPEISTGHHLTTRLMSPIRTKRNNSLRPVEFPMRGNNWKSEGLNLSIFERESLGRGCATRSNSTHLASLTPRKDGGLSSVHPAAGGTWRCAQGAHSRVSVRCQLPSHHSFPYGKSEKHRHKQSLSARPSTNRKPLEKTPGASLFTVRPCISISATELDRCKRQTLLRRSQASNRTLHPSHRR